MHNTSFTAWCVLRGACSFVMQPQSDTRSAVSRSHLDSNRAHQPSLDVTRDPYDARVSFDPTRGRPGDFEAIESSSQALHLSSFRKSRAPTKGPRVDSCGRDSVLGARYS